MATAEQLLDLDGVSSVAFTFRFDLLDNLCRPDPAGPLRPDRRHVPTMSNKLDDRYPRTVRGFDLDPDQADLVDVFGARIRPWMVLETGDEFSLGVLMFDAAHRLRRTSGSPLAGGLVDQSLVIDAAIEAAMGWGQGYPITTAMREVVDLFTLPLGFNIVPSSQVLGESVAMRPTATGREVLQNLATLAGYVPPYFDNDGVGQLRPSPSIAGAVADFTFVEGGRIVRDSIVDSDDLLEAPNVYVVTSKSASGAEIVGSYELPASAPHSISRRGRRVARFVDVHGIGAGPLADEAAQAAAAADVNAYQYVEFDTPIDPRHDTANVLDVTGQTFLETAWSFPMRPGALMHHEARRVYT